jgi:hypothetical protein
MVEFMDIAPIKIHHDHRNARKEIERLMNRKAQHT